MNRNTEPEDEGTEHPAVGAIPGGDSPYSVPVEQINQNAEEFKESNFGHDMPHFLEGDGRIEIRPVEVDDADRLQEAVEFSALLLDEIEKEIDWTGGVSLHVSVSPNSVRLEVRADAEEVGEEAPEPAEILGWANTSSVSALLDERGWGLYSPPAHVFTPPEGSTAAETPKDYFMMELSFRRFSRPAPHLDDLLELIDAGVSATAALDYLMVEKGRYSQSEWAERRSETSQPSISRNVKRAKETLAEE